MSWVHGRYLKELQLWEVTIPANSSWHWRKLVRVQDIFLPAIENGTWTPRSDGQYTPQSGYMWLMGDLQPFGGAKVIWNKLNVPNDSSS